MFIIKQKVLILLNLEEVRLLQKNHLLERFNYFLLNQLFMYDKVYGKLKGIIL